MLSDVEVVEAFFEAIYRLDFDAAVEFFTEDASYHDLPVPTDPAVGKEAIRRKLDFMIAGGVTSPADHLASTMRRVSSSAPATRRITYTPLGAGSPLDVFPSHTHE